MCSEREEWPYEPERRHTNYGKRTIGSRVGQYPGAVVGKFRGSINLNNAVPHSVEGEIGDGMQVEFPHQVGAMRFRRLNAQAEGRGNLFGSFAFGNELDDFALSRRQHVLFGVGALLQ